MAPQGNVLGHLKKVRGVGEVEELRMTPKERRGDAQEEVETPETPKPEVREEGLWRPTQGRAPKNDAGNEESLDACRK